jgi:hypothetical protein
MIEFVPFIPKVVIKYRCIASYSSPLIPGPRRGERLAVPCRTMMKHDARQHCSNESGFLSAIPGVGEYCSKLCLKSHRLILRYRRERYSACFASWAIRDCLNNRLYLMQGGTMVRDCQSQFLLTRNLRVHIDQPADVTRDPN